jgi:putative endonuclease
MRYNQGLLGEKLAIKYLLEKGYELLKHRYKTAYGEIDLIVFNKEIVFVEVKVRKYLHTELSIKQLTRNYNAAEYFLAENKHMSQYSSRFDLIVINNGIIHHIVDILMA